MKRIFLFQSFSIGFSSLILQILVLRELLSIFSGNELVIGIVLGNWLILTGLGSFLGGFTGKLKKPLFWLVSCQLALALLCYLEIVAVRYFKTLLLPGLSPGIGEVFWYSLLLLAPVCLIFGIFLPFLNKVVSEKEDSNKIGIIYCWDTIGALVGGVLFSFLLVYILSALQIASLLAIFNTSIALVLLHSSSRKIAVNVVIAGVLAMLTGSVLVESKIEKYLLSKMYPGQKIITRRMTRHGNLVVSKVKKQVNIYLDGIPVDAAGDEISSEENVHYALLQHPDPKKVLIISGGLSGAIREILKYPVEKVDYVELNPEIGHLVKIAQPEIADPRVRFIFGDGRLFLKPKKNEYDVILSILPNPSSAQLNRFYTIEFFRDLRRALKKNGVASIGIPGAENYAGSEVRLLTSSVTRAISGVFKNYLLFPGSRQYIVASDGAIDFEISKKLEQRGVKTRFLNKAFLAAKLSGERLSASKMMLSAEVPANRDFRPIGYYAYLSYWLSEAPGSLLLFESGVVVLLLIVGILLVSSKSTVVVTAVSSTGFFSMGFQVVLLISFQVIYGYVYHGIGAIITAFMIGAAVGAASANRYKQGVEREFVKPELFFAVFPFIYPALLSSLGSTDWLGETTVAIFFFFNLMVGFFTAVEFVFASRLLHNTGGGEVEKTAGSLYAIDLLGASLGALLVSAFVVPLAGVRGACYVLGGLKLISLLAVFLRREHLMQGTGAGRRSNVNNLIGFVFSLFIFGAIGYLISAEHSVVTFYSLTLGRGYHYGLLTLLGLGILSAMGVLQKGEDWITQKLSGINILRWVNYVGFGAVVFIPIFRCYFVVPYLFCHVCPRKCVFGVLRPYLIPAALIMNLERRHWCLKQCPIGTLHDCQSCLAAGRERIKPGWRMISMLVLLFTAIAYYIVQDDEKFFGIDWYNIFFTNRYIINPLTLTVASVFVVVAFRLWRPFCEVLCPIGTLSGLFLKLEKIFFKK